MAGVHLGQSDLPARIARRLVGEDAYLGLSAATPDELRTAQEQGACDHVGIGVVHPTATKALARLKREGLVTSRPYRGVFLTEAGAAMAERVRARHRLVVDFLVAVGVPAEAAETDAEGMEHYVSETTLEAFRRFLETPKAD